MKKQRGKRRYYCYLETVNYFTNPSDKARKVHLDALFRHFDYLVESL